MPGRSADGRSVLFVCHANTCRSVMAHVFLERLLAAHPAAPAVRVRSGGVGNSARDGMIPSLDTRLMLKEVGIHLPEDAIASTDLRRHRHLLAEASLILTMTDDQKRAVAAMAEAAGRPVFTLREFAGEAGDIDDPFGQSEERYRQARDEIRRCLERSLGRLLTVVGGD
jgi:protein-tyrosine-phosphatase